MSELLATVSGAEVKVWRPDAQVRARRASPPPGKRTPLGAFDRLSLVGTFARGIATRSLTSPPRPLSRSTPTTSRPPRCAATSRRTARMRDVEQP